MTKSRFMSPEHVAMMNGLLAESSAVLEECRDLDRSYTVHHDLSDGPGGSVHWTMTISPNGVVFGLEPPSSADLVFAAEYQAMVEAARAAREGRSADTQPTMRGDPGVLERIGKVFAAAQVAATVDVEFPNGGADDDRSG